MNPGLDNAYMAYINRLNNKKGSHAQMFLLRNTTGNETVDGGTQENISPIFLSVFQHFPVLHQMKCFSYTLNITYIL